MSIQKTLEEKLGYKVWHEAIDGIKIEITGIPEATAEIEALRQTEVCENCEYYGEFDATDINWEDYTETGCTVFGTHIDNPKEQTCRKDFKRKEGKNE